MECLTGFVLAGVALLPPCLAWERGLEQVPPRTPVAGPPYDGWRARGWVMLPVSLPLGYNKVPKKSRVPPGARAKGAPEGLH